MEQFEHHPREQIVVLTPSLTVVRLTMDLFQHRYYKLHRIMMTLLGQWPYHSIRVRRGTVAAFISLTWTQAIPLLMAIMKYRDDESILLDGALAVLFAAISLTNFLNLTWNSKKILQLLNHIRKDWYEWAEDREVNILHQYSERGRKMTIGYIGHNIFMIQPTIPKLIDVFLKNGTEPGQFPYPIDYYHLDIQKYYFYIIVFTYVCISATTLVVITNGIMLICYVQHVCGIFAALGYVNLIAASYSWNFFFTIGLGVILFNIIGLHILTRTNDSESIARFAIFILTLVVYFFVDCYICETVTDHIIGMYYCICNNQWYKLSLEAQKLLQFMVMRCSVPCQLKAGNMLVMSMRSFWLTFKTAISYLMLLHSLQEL